MNKILNFIDANPDSLVLPVLVFLLLIFTLGVFIESKKLKHDFGRTAAYVIFNMIACVVVFWAIILYLGLLIFDICK